MLDSVLQLLSRIVCRVVGHTHDEFVGTALEGEGYTITLYCQRCSAESGRG